MVRTTQESSKASKSWEIHGIEGVECFRACDLVHEFRRHSHEGYTIGVIENGFGDNNYRGSVFHLSPGKIVVMNPEEVHTGCVLDRQPWSYRMFYIHRDAFRGLLPGKKSTPFFSGLCFEDPFWFKRLKALHRLMETGGDLLEIQARFIEQMIRFAISHGKVSSAMSFGREPRAVRMVKDYINAHCTDNISIDDLTGITQLSRAYLIRTFTKSVGLPPHAYLIQTRVNRAKKQLARMLPVARVAYESGFSDQSHLTRHFKSITGITPKQYAMGHRA